MAKTLLPYAYLRDPRLAGHATAATGAWLWQPDGARILWANAAAAAMLGAPSPAALAHRSFDASDPFAAQAAQLAETLPANGSPRLIALQVPAHGGDGPGPMCLCSRLLLDDGTPAILAIATGAGRDTLPFAERVRQLLGDIDAPVAAFSPDGALIHATPAAADRMNGLATLASMGADTLGGEALAKGHANGVTPLGLLHLDRIGRDGATALLVTFPAEPVRPAEPSASAEIEALDEQAETAPDIAAVTPATADIEQQAPMSEERPSERPHPVRFVWQMDRDGRFTITSEAFIALIGPRSAAALGQPWIDVARKLNLDPEEQISRAIDSRETWSGIAVSWPVDGVDERLMVDMSGLPTFDRERNFLGYRGFGVCRDADRFATLPRAPEAPLVEDTTQQPDNVAAPAEASSVDEETESQNVMPFRSAPETETKAPALSATERTAFRELARQLNARLKGGQPEAGEHADTQPTTPERNVVSPKAATDDAPKASAPTHDGVGELMERLPVGVLVYRFDMPIYANRAFLKWSGDASLEAFTASGGLDRLFLESDVSGGRDDAGKKLTLTTGENNGLAESRLFSIMWNGERAHALAVVPMPAPAPVQAADLPEDRRRVEELRSIVDISADGVVTTDGDGAIVRLNKGAEVLFGCASAAVEGKPFVALLAAESREQAAIDFAALAGDPAGRHSGLEVNGVSREAGSVTLFMTLGRIAGDRPAYCAVFRDVTAWKRTEDELISAKRLAEQASRAKSDFLAKISHEIRTPLNAIIGFAEVMMEERLGPIENERYRAYLKDIHASGDHVVSLLNDLLDLSKIEAGKLELSFASVNLNEITQQCVALMQPQANNARVIIRTSLAPALPPIVADGRSVRQILLNLLSNSIKFTAAGGQVIVSTAPTEGSEAVLRVRDTGIGMSEKELETALEPFRQIETSTRRGSGGTGLGLPLTKALAEANRANFAIKSNVNSGTLVEVAFPTTPTPAQ